MTGVASPATTWRVLPDTGERDVPRNLALDEALARAGGPVPAVRLWRNRRAVILGRFQVAAAEVDEVACHELGAPVYRRFTGGGAVYHDPGTLCLSVVVPRRDPVAAAGGHAGLPAGLPGIYRLVLEPLAAATRRLGVAAEATEREVLVDGRKVAGVAAWIGASAVLVHATLLVEADLGALERTLDGPGAPGDPRWERTKSRRAPVTSLEHVLRGRRAPVPAAATVDAAVLEAMSTTGRDRHFAPGRITDTEAALAERLLAERYARPAWHATGTS